MGMVGFLLFARINPFARRRFNRGGVTIIDERGRKRGDERPRRA
jgi:hypothetical protein